MRCLIYIFIVFFALCSCVPRNATSSLLNESQIAHNDSIVVSALDSLHEFIVSYLEEGFRDNKLNIKEMTWYSIQIECHIDNNGTMDHLYTFHNSIPPSQPDKNDELVKAYLLKMPPYERWKTLNKDTIHETTKIDVSIHF